MKIYVNVYFLASCQMYKCLVEDKNTAYYNTYYNRAEVDDYIESLKKDYVVEVIEKGKVMDCGLPTEWVIQ